MEEPHKVDRRVAKTKRAIRNAFMRLLSVKDYNVITIKDIADAADVDRKTVYNYYSGVYEIQNEVENEIVELLEQAFKKLDFENNINNPIHIFEVLTEVLSTDLELYGYLMQLNSSSYITRKINTALRNKICDGLKKVPFLTGCDYDLCADFITSGMLTVYQHWFNSGRTKPLEHLSEETGRLVLYGLSGIKDKAE